MANLITLPETVQVSDGGGGKWKEAISVKSDDLWVWSLSLGNSSVTIVLWVWSLSLGNSSVTIVLWVWSLSLSNSNVTIVLS